jgi:hypothetical protein
MNKKIVIAIILSAVLCSFGFHVYADDPIPVDSTTTPSTSNTQTPTPVTDPTTSVPPPAPTETVIIRNAGTVIYSGSVPLPPAGTVSIPDSSGSTHDVSADSVLALIYTIAQSSGKYTLSDLEYYSSFNAFYVKCVTPSGGSEACDDWQYMVNDNVPSTGMDQTILSGGESIGVYFGSQHQLTIDKTIVTAGDSVIVTAQTYHVQDNTWSTLSGVTIGATEPTANDPSSPTVVTTQAVDANGTATLSFKDPGTYTIGIVEDYYTPSYTETVTPVVVAPTAVVEMPVSRSGGGGMIIDPHPLPSFSAQNAFTYLASVQSADGSFGGSDMYTDWAAVALGTADATNSSRARVLAYMDTHASVSTLVTDNERTAMALLALGQNPYSFEGADYIAPIVNAFDGTQFGDPTLVNDDIFALIPLSASGYTASDTIIQKDITFILSKQQADGSWDESVDLTAATVQALELFQTADGVPVALSHAQTYIQNLQGADGGFGTIFSSSWAAQAMDALGESWMKNGKSVDDYFSAQQSPDGAMLLASDTLSNRIWATSYAVPAALGESWSMILHHVSKPATVQNTAHVTSTNMESPVVVVPTPTISAQNLKASPSHAKVVAVVVAKSTVLSQPIMTKRAPIAVSALAATAVGADVSLPSTTILDKAVYAVTSTIARFVHLLF